MDGAEGQYTDCVLYMLKVVWTLSSVQFRMASVSVPRNGRNVGLNVHSNNRGLIRFIRDGVVVVVVVVVVGIGYLCSARPKRSNPQNQARHHHRNKR